MQEPNFVKDNRLHPRYEGVIADYAVFADSVDKNRAMYKPVFVRNFSKGGACFFLDEKINRKHRVVFRLYDAYNVEPIEALGGIVWMRRAEDSPGEVTHYDLGIKIVYIDENNQERLEQLIQYFDTLKHSEKGISRNL